MTTAFRELTEDWFATIRVVHDLALTSKAHMNATREESHGLKDLRFPPGDVPVVSVHERNWL